MKILEVIKEKGHDLMEGNSKLSKVGERLKIQRYYVD